jgi:hypothetical protein
LILFFRICYFLHGAPVQTKNKQNQIIHNDFDPPDDWPIDDDSLFISEDDVIADQNLCASILIQHLSSINSTAR